MTDWVSWTEVWPWRLMFSPSQSIWNLW